MPYMNGMLLPDEAAEASYQTLQPISRTDRLELLAVRSDVPLFRKQSVYPCRTTRRIIVISKNLHGRYELDTIHGVGSEPVGKKTVYQIALETSDYEIRREQIGSRCSDEPATPAEGALDDKR